ncbi:MAG: ribbon-helix-helix protein, CopG family [Lachnospira sp.]|jgi:metal-responsive CopG/Arc/MetJ family transcriptional regulator|nr:ribbon-helix-helix protein, CopG family [Lachnospira sp.]
MNEENLIIKKKRPKGEDGYKTFSIRIKEELVFEIDELSSKTGRSRNELIGILLQYSIKHCKIEDE